MTEATPTVAPVEIDTPRTRLIEDLRGSISYAQKHLDGFVTDLRTNPLHAFQWAGGQVKYAAELDLKTTLVAALTREGNPATLAQVKKYLLDLALRHARNPPASTSVMSNLCESAKAEAAATIYESVLFYSDEGFDLPVPPPAPRPAPPAVSTANGKRSRR